MRTVILAGLAILLTGAATESTPIEPPHTYTQDDPRFDLGALTGICSDVRAKNSFRYEAKVSAAARVGSQDSATEMRTKVGALFRDHSRGNLLKYAVAVRTYDFLYTAANVWQIDLNVADESDGLTVLDYTVATLERNRGRPAEAELTDYRDMLIRAGARTTAQLQAGEDCRPSTRCRQ